MVCVHLNDKRRRRKSRRIEKSRGRKSCYLSTVFLFLSIVIVSTICRLLNWAVSCVLCVLCVCVKLWEVPTGSIGALECHGWSNILECMSLIPVWVQTERNRLSLVLFIFVFSSHFCLILWQLLSNPRGKRACWVFLRWREWRRVIQSLLSTVFHLYSNCSYRSKCRGITLISTKITTNNKMTRKEKSKATTCMPFIQSRAVEKRRYQSATTRPSLPSSNLLSNLPDS